ncbi:hypothetical protein C8R45DRAFT_313381 [Mycena sanguinolenta]|nr:hypothetical protein C8R45DRAFT_313381 [Mycena sanguinolenta]
MNYMRSDLEADRARVAEITTCVAQMQAQVRDLKRSITELRAEQDIAQQRIDSFKYYPVLTLPNEIISEIFLHFLPAYPAYPPLFGTPSPTSLTQICRKWRGLALATPGLWRAIEFRWASGLSE